VDTGTVDREGSIRLLSVILWELPSMPLAACRGRHELFEEVPYELAEPRAERLAAMEFLCGGCPERHRCPTC
jgi:hypothetical protein